MFCIGYLFWPILCVSVAINKWSGWEWLNHRETKKKFNFHNQSTPLPYLLKSQMNLSVLLWSADIQTCTLRQTQKGTDANTQTHTHLLSNVMTLIYFNSDQINKSIQKFKNILLITGCPKNYQNLDLFFQCLKF